MSPELRRHRWAIPAVEYERHERRRGRRHAFETLSPASTAVVVVDMVPFFVDSNQYARSIIGPINQLTEEARATDTLVTWVVPGRTEPTALDIEFYGDEVAKRYANTSDDGTTRLALAPELTVADEDEVVSKVGPSPFFPGRSALPALLASRSIDTVVIAGTVANVCCESTARDARNSGYRVVMAADAIAAGDDDMLNATLRTIYRSFGDVRACSEIVGLLRGS